MNLQALGKILGTLRWEGGIQGRNAVSVEAIHYKNNNVNAVLRGTSAKKAV